jgi:GntR family transcriptional regulator
VTRGSHFPSRSIPLYCQLENILREKIETGEILPGQRLLTEQELSRQYQISRATVRQALAALVSEGLLYRKQGRGTFVTEKAQQTRAAKLTGFTEDLIHQGHRPEVQVLEKKRAPAPDEVAHHLHLAPGAEVVRFKRLRRVGGVILSYVVNYVRSEYGEQITEEDLAGRSMLRLLEEKVKVRLGTVHHAVEAMKADAEVAGLLELLLQEPVLYIETLARSAEGHPVEVASSFFRADRYRYTVDLVWDQPTRMVRPPRA